ncbi:hypothetical protein PIB30_003144 [Stylosanthes scabra]|uniref:PB1 domain-containing protein n=1 Tax=Stylosanthes scabra TaxID=79078 RepID=A0ABU6Z3Q4_9FABA|nr:hypothetical protein [Stylosanthes scabra]
MADNTVARFMCSYGGEIRRNHSSNNPHFSYYGGNNRMLQVDRNISFHNMTTELSALCGGGAINYFKYLIPGDDLDTLITVTNDRDLGYMMREFDLHFRSSTDRMRIFLFLDPVHNGATAVNASNEDQRVIFMVVVMVVAVVVLMLLLILMLLFLVAVVVITLVVVVVVVVVATMEVMVGWWWLWWRWRREDGDGGIDGRAKEEGSV